MGVDLRVEEVIFQLWALLVEINVKLEKKYNEIDLPTNIWISTNV
jgi:hypothetical protein